MKSLADRIEEKRINVCCLREDNLYVGEHETGHRVVRVCRVCHSRHIRMKAQPGRLGLRRR